MANQLDLEFLTINSNLNEKLNYNFVEVHTFLSSSAILALQKLFKTYYYASGYPLDKFKMGKNTTAANFDLLTLSSLSTPNLKFYTAGIEKSRLEKVKNISEYKPSYNNLNVSQSTFENCGECDKCIRNQLELYSINKLELYDDVFDLEKFYKNLNSHLGYIITYKEVSYNNEILKELKNNRMLTITPRILMSVQKHRLQKIYAFMNRVYKFLLRKAKRNIGIA